MPFTVAILILSDLSSRGQREDLSGPTIRDLVQQGGGKVLRSLVLPDERAEIARTLASWADEGVIDVIITTGGTGLSPRDVTPEATKEVIEREVPGIAEVIRIESLKKTPMAMFSRAIAGIRKQTLIVNLPGSPKAVQECLEVLLPVLPHAVETLRASVQEHPQGGTSNSPRG